MMTNNGIAQVNYSKIFSNTGKKENYENAKNVIKEITKIKTSQLSKSIYYGLEILSIIHERINPDKENLRSFYEKKIEEKSYSWAIQMVETQRDFDQYGGVNGYLAHYYEETFAKSSDDNDYVIGNFHIKRQNQFIDIALVHSFITCNYRYLIQVYCDVKTNPGPDKEKYDKKMARLNNLIASIHSINKKIIDEIDEELDRRNSGERLDIESLYPPNPIRLKYTVDDQGQSGTMSSYV